ncbi:putative beta-xylosidase [Halobacteroides halobius DSM 5150]|uniref:Putative beta-xylosidase n=1 Tax=Halobacteroides halobius (strain ATCC 35273 / DSM 5150 / MD-1) TaxID=748449 RepID=L0KA66_HALHC|nr:glycoside hydrolase family 43 protein [Halobacteroides halobius]AGB41264.1 putative beta-xylosidase [Halobacteroides halobius DSM 5150]
MSKKFTIKLSMVICTLLVFSFSNTIHGFWLFDIFTGGDKMEKTYTNPVGGITNIGDPYVLKYNGRYYLYATSAPSIGFKVWTSKNLVDWKEKGLALDSSLKGNKWGRGDFWAPEVEYYQGKFYMTYSARDKKGHLQIALAASDNPLGPFKNVKAPLFNRGKSYIDGHIFVDDDGTPYLYYVKDCSENIINGKHISQIYVQEMSKDLTTLKGEPTLAIEPSQSWEGIKKDWQWNEGPYVLKHNEIYYLMYSANVYSSSDYAIGYATAPSPLGPWKKYNKNPILSKNMEKGISGPGHNSVTTSLDGSKMYIVYHTHTYPKFPSGNRTVNIDLMYFEDGILKVDGPTRSPQPMPNN